MATMDVSRKADITMVSGSTGSGKSTWVKKQIRTKKRVIIWDPDSEYDEITTNKVTTIKALATLMNAAGKGSLKVRFIPPFVEPGDDKGDKLVKGLFNLWAAAVFRFANCTAVAEELSDVTSSGKAPAGWGQLIRRGRKYGISIFGLSQRPAESDKTIIGNASSIHVGMLNFHKDRKYMAECLNVPIDEIAQLKEFEFIRIDFRTKTLKKGKLTF